MKTSLSGDALRGLLALSGAATLAIIIYVVVLINTLIKIWHAEFQDPKEKRFWFLFVLILSPIGLPLYLINSRNRKTGQSDPAGDHKRAGMSDDDRARELARLLEMRKNGVLSNDEFNSAKKRLS